MRVHGSMVRIMGSGSWWPPEEFYGGIVSLGWGVGLERYLY